MPELLEVAHLPEDDGVAEVEVGRGRVEADLHAEGLARLRGARSSFFSSSSLLHAGLDALEEEVELFGDGRKACHGPRL